MTDGSKGVVSETAPRQPGRIVRRRLTVAGGLLAVGSFAVLMCLMLLDVGFSGRAANPGVGTTVMIVRPEVRSFLGVLGWGCALLAAACGLALLVNRLRVAGMILLLIAASFPLYSGGWFVARLLLWWDAERLQVTEEALCVDSVEYRLGSYGMLQGVTGCLVAVSDKGPFFHRARIISTFNMDYPRNWAPVVRPAGQPGRRLYESPDGKILVFVGRHHCYLMYDPKSGVATDTRPLSEAISPFALIGPQGAMTDGDVRHIVMAAEAAQGAGPHQPNKELLTEALARSNPEVRQAAQQMLDAMGP